MRWEKGKEEAGESERQEQEIKRLRRKDEEGKITEMEDAGSKT